MANDSGYGQDRASAVSQVWEALWDEVCSTPFPAHAESPAAGPDGRDDLQANENTG